MKKFSFITSLGVIAFLVFFTSCETTNEGPSISFLGGEYIDADATVAPGSVLKFKWIANKGSSNLSSFTIERDGIALSGYPDESISNDNYQDSVTLEAPLNLGEYVYQLIVTDKNDLTASGKFTITVEQTAGPINTWTKTLGAHQSTTGSSFASITGTVYTMDDAKANSTLIDFLYYYGATNHATIASPDDATAATVFNNVNNGLATWSTKNSTRFKSTTLTAANFDAIANDLEIVTNATGASDSYENGLEVGEVIAFVTAPAKATGSKKGLIKVVSITAGATETMEITVKVQQ